MIAHYNKTNKTLCIRGYNIYGKVILKWSTDPLPPEIREEFKYYCGGKPLLIDHMNKLKQYGLWKEVKEH